MAMIKCASCKKTVSDSNEICPYCGGKTDNKVYCPKCRSTNVSIIVKEPGGLLMVVFTVLFGWLVGLVTFILSLIFGKRIKYKCNNCGKKFKIK